MENGKTETNPTSTLTSSYPLESVKSNFSTSWNTNLSTPSWELSRVGYGWLTATVFIVGEVAGGGILSLPKAISHAGWSGISLIVFCGVGAAVAGLYLAKSWLILEERYPERYRQVLTRKPFATIGYHAFGRWMSMFVSIILNVTNIGSTTAFLLITCSILKSLTDHSIGYSICNWLPIISAALLLPMWFGSPMDFWPIAYTAMLSTLLGSALLIIAIILHIAHYGVQGEYKENLQGLVGGAFGTIIFSFGGASVFPNIQNDMAEKDKFPKAVIVAFVGLILLYIPMAALGYGAFGTSVNDSVIKNLNQNTLITVIELCFLVHCFTVTLILINPVYLDLEELLRIPAPFTWKRCVFRTLLLGLMTFLGATFPSFGKVIDLIGGSTMTTMSFILPPLFYWKLCTEKSDNANHQWIDRTPSTRLKVLFLVIILCGVAGCVASTYISLATWMPLESACYLPNTTASTPS